MFLFDKSSKTSDKSNLLLKGKDDYFTFADVTGSDAGSKLEKAKIMSVTVLDEQKFKRLLGRAED